MRKQVLVGIEKEYVCVTSLGDQEYYALANDKFLEIVQRPLEEMGWKVIREYSGAILEVISLPVMANDVLLLFDDLERINALFASTMVRLETGSPIYLSDKHSVLLEKFVRLDGSFTNNLAEIVIEDDDKSDLDGLIRTLPKPEFLDANVHDAALRFAGFTALNVTISHPTWTVENVLHSQANRILFGRWIFERACALQNRSTIPDNQTVDDLHRAFANWITSDFQEAVHASPVDIIAALYGHERYSDWSFKQKTNYIVRPRIIGGNVCAEFRCFGSDICVDELRNITNDLIDDAHSILMDKNNVSS